MDPKYGTILGITINSTSVPQVLRQVSAKIATISHNSKNEPILIVTPNPEIVLQSTTDNKLSHIINSASISIPDGVGLLLADKFLKMNAPKGVLRLPSLIFNGLSAGFSLFANRKQLFEGGGSVIKGRELFIDLVALANRNSWKMYFLGGRNGSAKKASDFLKRSYKNLDVRTSDGPMLNKDGDPVSERDILIQKDVIKDINEYSPDILILGFGAPKQEKWAYKWKNNLETKVIMTAGGTFDYYSGNLRLPPQILSSIGLEWLWRLLSQPGRLKRIINAVIVFPLKVLQYKYNLSD